MDHFLKILNFLFGIIMCCTGSRFLNRLNTQMHISVHHSALLLLRQNLPANKRSLFSFSLHAVPLLPTIKVADMRGTGGPTRHPQSERSVQLGWTPCLCQVTWAVFVHLAQFHVIWAWSEQRLASVGTEGSAETSRVNREISFPRACRMRVCIMSPGSKAWSDYLLFDVFVYDGIS